MKTNSINAVFKGGRHFSTSVNGHTIEIDTKKESGGNDLGPSPKILMLVALAGCTGFDVVSILEKMHVHFSDFSIRVDGELTDTEPAVYDKAIIHYTIKIADEDRPKMERAVHLSEDKYCGVSKMFKSFAEVGFQITYL